MNVKSKLPKTVKLKTYLVTVLLISVIFAGALSYTIGQPYIGDVSEVWIQPPFHEASYVVGVYNSTFFYGMNGTTGKYEWLSADEESVINSVIGNATDGDTIYVKSGLYVLGATITDHSKNGITLILERGAILKADTNLNDNVIYISNVNYWRIIGGEIDGNKANQNGTPDGDDLNGVLMEQVTHSSVESVYIHHCKRTGVQFSYPCHHGGVRDCHLAYNGWNGITLGGNIDFEDGYAINNWVEHSSDVGISMYAIDTTITGNHVTDMDQTDGYNNAGWGISQEKGRECIIANNVVENVKKAYTISSITTRCIISNNVAKDWDRTGEYLAAIAVHGDYNLISNNHLYTTEATTNGIRLYGGTYNKVDGNTIECAGNAVYVGDNGNYNDITNNWIKGATGVRIVAGCDYTFISENNFDLSTDDISDSGNNTRYGNNLWKDGSYDNTPPA